MDYIWNIGILVGVYAILAMSLGFLVGKVGIVSFCHAIFYGCGGYGVAIVAYRWGLPFYFGVIAGLLTSGVLGFVVGSVMAKVPRDVAATITVVLQIVWLAVVKNWTTFTRGSLGIWGISSPNINRWQIDSNAEFFCLTVVLCTSVAGILWLVQRSPYTRVLLAIREDPVRTASLGKSVQYAITSAVVLSAMLASLAGSLYAHFFTYVSPDSFSFDESILILAIVIIGGAGKISGAILAAVVVISLPELITLAISNSVLIGNIRQMFYGTMLVLVIVLRPNGLLRGSSLDGEDSLL